MAGMGRADSSEAAALASKPSPMEPSPMEPSPLEPSPTEPPPVGTEATPHPVHDVVADPLEQAHDRLRFTEQAELLLAHQALHPVQALAFAAQDPAELLHRVATQRRRVLRERGQLPFE